jgi:hypothetical protein
MLTSYPIHMLRIFIVALLPFLVACVGNSTAPDDELVSLKATGFVQAEGIT